MLTAKSYCSPVGHNLTGYLLRPVIAHSKHQMPFLSFAKWVTATSVSITRLSSLVCPHYRSDLLINYRITASREKLHFLRHFPNGRISIQRPVRVLSNTLFLRHPMIIHCVCSPTVAVRNWLLSQLQVRTCGLKPLVSSHSATSSLVLWTGLSLSSSHL